MSTQPTPGPWTVGPHQRIISSGWSIRIADDSAIAYVLGEKNPEMQANARLIAAAPTLLATLQLIAQTRPVHGMNPNAMMSDPDNVKVGWNVHWIAQAALAKVEGLDVVGEPT